MPRRSEILIKVSWPSPFALGAVFQAWKVEEAIPPSKPRLGFT